MNENYDFMITEDYVSFEVAKLLKEKGFHEPCIATYNSTTKNFQVEEIYEDWTIHWKDYISAPTHQMVMKWLREKYHIEIHITFGFPYNSLIGKSKYKYFWSIIKVCDDHLEYPMNKPDSMEYHEEQANKYEETVEAALKYVLENLI